MGFHWGTNMSLMGPAVQEKCFLRGYRQGPQCLFTILPLGEKNCLLIFTLENQHNKISYHLLSTHHGAQHVTWVISS